jgi:site-specific DNA-methyltransferase (adenine-specific)
MWNGERKEHPEGRWPSNVVFSHHPQCERVSESNEALGACSEETWKCYPACPVYQLEKQSPGASKFFPIFEPEYSHAFVYKLKPPNWEKDDGTNNLYWKNTEEGPVPIGYQEWTQLPNEEKTRGNIHPTVKAVSLMRYFVRLCTPPGGTVLDPFAGSGTTALACLRECSNFVGIERFPPYILIANARIEHTKIKITVANRNTKPIVSASIPAANPASPVFSPEIFEKAARRALKRFENG